MAAAKGYYRNLGHTTQNLPFHPDFMPEVGVSKDILDADTCITCFCCQEVCPEKAMTLT
jgi:formate hydrogenlyase subunit 6/NADH:ubiquinone oxidoreductase subunit I